MSAFYSATPAAFGVAMIAVYLALWLTTLLMDWFGSAVNGR